MRSFPLAVPLTMGFLALGCPKPAPVVCPTPQSCKDFDFMTANLAETTVACTGTIGPQSFEVREGILQRKFTSCPAASAKEKDKDRTNAKAEDPGALMLKTIDDLLALQKFPRNLHLRECYAEPWTAWFAHNGDLVCPTWQNAGPASGFPTADSVKAFADKLPKLERKREAPPEQPWLAKPEKQPPIGKAFFYYKVSFPSGTASSRDCGDAVSCARQCSAGLAGFFTDATDDGRVRGDFVWWWDPTSYGAGSDPYVPSYYHPMSYYGDLPGARFAHPNRVGEPCSYFDGYSHVPGSLCGPQCAAPGVGCVSVCMPISCSPPP